MKTCSLSLSCSRSSCIHAMCHPPCLEIESLSSRLPWQTDGLCSIWAPSAVWKPLMGAEDDGSSFSPVSAYRSPWANFKSLSVKLGLIATMEVALSGTVLHRKVGCFLSFIPVCVIYFFLLWESLGACYSFFNMRDQWLEAPGLPSAGGTLSVIVISSSVACPSIKRLLCSTFNALHFWGKKRKSMHVSVKQTDNHILHSNSTALSQTRNLSLSLSLCPILCAWQTYAHSQSVSHTHTHTRTGTRTHTHTGTYTHTVILTAFFLNSLNACQRFWLNDIYNGILPQSACYNCQTRLM